ncbi:hypothetical protein AcW1_007969 [Taiwanofungus camphoratus]|nr:hypothetical protein AcW1_007969 [Antrodia cinnamomea]
MEFVEGETLQTCGINELSVAAQEDFLTRMTHAYRAIKCAGIHQQDWHASHIICPRVFNRCTGAYDLEIVFLDFGFAVQWLDDDDGTPVMHRMWETPLHEVLVDKAGILFEIVYKCWYPHSEPEY